MQRAVTLFAQAPAPYFVLNSQGRIQVNVAGCGLLGHQHEALIGQPLARFLEPSSGEALTGNGPAGEGLDALLERVRDSGLRQRIAARLRHAEGDLLDVLLDANAERVDGGTPGPFRVVVTDVTGLTGPDTAGVPSQRREGGQEEAFRAQAVRLQALEQELDQVMGTFIRQLQRPLTRALSFLGLTPRALGQSPGQSSGAPVPEAAKPAGDPQLSLLNAEQAVQQATALLSSVQSYMQVRKMRVRLRSVDLNRVLREVLKSVQPLLADRRVRITHDPLPTVQGDSQALSLILEEYVSNALKFTKRRGEARIHIGVQETDTEYLVSVQDNGAGFNMAQGERLFQLFGRLHSSRVYEGTGVGLITVQRACQRFGGRVWAEGEVDSGATFWFSWPREPLLEAEG